MEATETALFYVKYVLTKIRLVRLLNPRFSVHQQKKVHLREFTILCLALIFQKALLNKPLSPIRDIKTQRPCGILILTLCLLDVLEG